MCDPSIWNGDVLERKGLAVALEREAQRQLGRRHGKFHWIFRKVSKAERWQKREARE